MVNNGPMGKVRFGAIKRFLKKPLRKIFLKRGN
jgi:hypothetical protein